MKKSRFTEKQIVAILKEHEAGLSAKELCRKHNVSQPTFYRWKSKYEGMEVNQVVELKELQAENAKLKRMYAEACLEKDALSELLKKL